MEPVRMWFCCSVEVAVPNGHQKTICTAFQEVKALVGTEVHSDEDVKRILSLKGQI
ncbi:hypothetical protein [uncultured Gemmiger sp.]|uniref:hypothetical protein n=1 Tax=uncultured Gemmiger sp. TaxID=1623490 RepID=UPI0025FBF37B|nr:hypothetical protein [uncultured Gemmiger sp.]